jgi:uncharacterized RDD family membrane protein YckC
MLIRFDKRTLHDILAGTRVVRKSAPAVTVEADADIDEQPNEIESE